MSGSRSSAKLESAAPSKKPELALRSAPKPAECLVSVSTYESGASSTCRVCWGEADADQGGELLKPCKCTGSLEFIHARCLREWAVSQQALQRRDADCCEICKGKYSGPGLPIPPCDSRVSLPVWFRILLRSPAFKAYMVTGAFCGMAGCSSGAMKGIAAVPTLFWDAREDPKSLVPLAKQLAFGTLATPISGLGIPFFSQAALLYTTGLILDISSCHFIGLICQQHALPRLIHHLLAWPLVFAQLAGMGLQAFHLTLLGFLGGAQAGFVWGIHRWASLPLALLRSAWRCIWASFL